MVVKAKRLQPLVLIARGAPPSHGLVENALRILQSRNLDLSQVACRVLALFTMMRPAVFIVVTCACIVVLHTSAGSTPVHPPELQKVSDCAIATIIRITAGLEGTSAHDTSSAIVQANGVSGVSYKYVPTLHASPRTTKLYDRTGDEITLDEVERITI